MLLQFWCFFLFHAIVFFVFFSRMHSRFDAFPKHAARDMNHMDEHEWADFDVRLFFSIIIVIVSHLVQHAAWVRTLLPSNCRVQLDRYILHFKALNFMNDTSNKFETILTLL